MNYFTREELEDITNELLENPTRETLKHLNEKYNGSTEVGEVLVKGTPIENIEPPVVEIPSPLVEEQSVVVEMPQSVETPMVAMPILHEESPVMAPVTNIEVPKMEVNANNGAPEMPFFDLPKLETPIVNNQNNEPVNFNGNLFETGAPIVENLMQTTENFNSVPNTMPTTEVPVSPAPFFGPIMDTTSNPIPVGGPTNTMPNMGPTMFGQMQQNYM